MRNPGVYGPEVVARVGIVAERDDRRGAAVEVAGHHDDVRGIRRHALHPVAPRAGDLDARLDGLGARVHRQHHVLAAERRELGDERAEPVVVEGAARERDAVELLARGRDEHAGCRARSSPPSRRRGSRGSGARRRRSPRRPRRMPRRRAAGGSCGRRARPRRGWTRRSEPTAPPVDARPHPSLGSDRRVQVVDHVVVEGFIGAAPGCST